jgi:capsular polysaccharide biosynthesis protein/MinD-like ATPase involved in chromosome partitioning or flagellar assembly
MTLEQYLHALLQRWKLIVTCIVLLGIAAYFGSELMKPIYQSTALVQIGFSSTANNQQSDYTSLLADDQLLQTETTLATSDPVLREVASHYPGLTSSALAAEVSVSPKTNTQLFEIDVQDPNPVRAASLANDIANTLIQQQTQMEQTTFLFLVQPARPASSPVRPNVRLNTAIGLGAGLLLALALVLLLERSDTRVRTTEELTQLLGWPLLGSIWQAKLKKEVIDPAETSADAEAYRILRTNIGFAAIDKPLCTILVTSAITGEGRSVVAANLAIFMAKAGRSTLLIEADFRRPGLSKQFGIPAGTKGLSNAILEFTGSPIAKAPAERQPATSPVPRRPASTPPVTGVSLDRFICAVDVPNLCVMPTGPLPPNPAELLDSKAMQHFLKALDACGVEVVVFDAPPLLDLSDARILAAKLDGTIVVVDSTRSEKGYLKQVKTLLEQAGACVLGYVVNKLPRGRDQETFSRYYSALKRIYDKRSSRQNRHGVAGNVQERITASPEAGAADTTVKIAAVHHDKGETQSWPAEIPDRNRASLTPVPPTQTEAQFQSDLLDESKKGLRKSGR